MRSFVKNNYLCRVMIREVNMYAIKLIIFVSL